MKRLLQALFGGTSKPVPKSSIRKSGLSCVKGDNDLLEESPTVHHHSPSILSHELDVTGNIDDGTDYQNPDQLSEDERIDFLENYNETHPSFGIVFEYVLATSDTVENFDWLYSQVNDGGEYAKKIVEKLESVQSGTFSEWLTVYDDSSDTNEFTSVVLRKCISLAQDCDDWNSLYQAVDNSTEDDQQIVLKALQNVEWSEEQWKKFLDDCEDELLTVIYEKLLAFKGTASQVLEFYIETVENYELDDDVHQVFFDRLFSVATREEIKIISLLSKEKELDELDDATEKFLKN